MSLIYNKFGLVSSILFVILFTVNLYKPFTALELIKANYWRTFIRNNYKNHWYVLFGWKKYQLKEQENPPLFCSFETDHTVEEKFDCRNFLYRSNDYI